ncbi:hypothetical protein EJ110_NYTH34726 [Nymphaea thermarum]|nr:hypothetical protein EJ110_NYTH34726 [Nymphaea thermarum]
MGRVCFTAANEDEIRRSLDCQKDANPKMACVLLYAFVFPKLEIVKYYRSKAASGRSKIVSTDLAAGGVLQDTVRIQGHIA